MNKLFIGLLIVAAGAGVFFLIQKKKNHVTANSINKELIIGKWKAEAANDSLFSQYSYDFMKDGNIVRSLNDSVKADTSRYEWNKKNELVLSTWTLSEKQTDADSVGKVFAVLKLTKDSLQVQSKDSAMILFIKTK